jgi:hypothetical protein
MGTVILRWLGDHAIEVAAAALSAGALLFAALTWRRGRKIVTAKPPTIRDRKHGSGKLRAVQPTLEVVLQARRNGVYIAGTYIEVGSERIWGRDYLGIWKSARLNEGDKLIRYWPTADVRHLPANKRWHVGWQDSEDDRHRLAVVSKANVKLLTAEQTAEGGSP